jgi:hypothetical protein
MYWITHKVCEENGSYSKSISRLMSLALPFMTETVVVVIEKQIRCQGLAFRKHGMNNCLVEAGVEQFFINKLPSALTVRFDARLRLRNHNVNMANIMLKQSLKTQSVQICKQFLNLNIQHANIQNYFDHHGKKDDLSDCLLQALAYYNMNLSSFPRLVIAREESDVLDDSVLDLTDDSSSNVILIFNLNIHGLPSEFD